ncbi:hypothetical protein [Candidatus Clostridium stratigraminis]|uniref:Uncharacterized protein n=1 Tax=Candidatus Clostridium stratigraminis TaxID=3381661 RepID=A0ABW8T466_9CLOT
MPDVNNLINQQLPHITTNTIILIIVAIIAIYVLIKVISSVIKIIAFLAVCWLILMSVQSTNLVNIPLVKQSYTAIERIIPSKELWTKATSYVKDADKIKKAIEDLNKK